MKGEHMNKHVLILHSGGGSQSCSWQGNLHSLASISPIFPDPPVSLIPWLDNDAHHLGLANCHLKWDTVCSYVYDYDWWCALESMCFCVSTYLFINAVNVYIMTSTYIYIYIYIVIILQFQCAPFHQSVVRGGSTPKNYLSKFLQAYIWAVHKASNVIHLVHSKQDLCCQRPILNSFLTKGHVEQRPKKLGTYKHLLNLNLSCLAVSK